MKDDESTDAPRGESRAPLPDDIQREIAHRVLVNGERQNAVQTDLAKRGISVSAATISRICQRVEARATAIPPTVHTDPVTGIEVEQTEDSILQDMERDLWREYRAAKGNVRDKTAIAKVMPGLVAARLKLREPPPPKPGEPGQPQPPEPPQPTELVRFN